jgi:hypothetical protein
MALNLFEEKGCPLDRQRFTWKELVQPPISKLDNDAFTRVRIILMNSIEMEALRFSHSCARMNQALQLPLVRQEISHGKKYRFRNESHGYRYVTARRQVVISSDECYSPYFAWRSKCDCKNAHRIYR